MISRRFSLCLLVLLFIHGATAQQASCQETTRPWWNPFASESKTTPLANQSSANDSKLFTGSGSPSMFKLPNWELPSLTKKPTKTKKNSASTMSRLGNTTKRWWDNTVDFINPFDSPAPTTRQSQGYQPQNQAKQKDSSGAWDWLKGTEPRQEPTTVNEFLRQPPVRY